MVVIIIVITIIVIIIIIITIINSSNNSSKILHPVPTARSFGFPAAVLKSVARRCRTLHENCIQLATAAVLLRLLRLKILHDLNLL